MSRRADNFAGDRVTKIYAHVEAKVDSLEVRSLFAGKIFPGIYLAREAAAPPTSPGPSADDLNHTAESTP